MWKKEEVYHLGLSHCYIYTHQLKLLPVLQLATGRALDCSRPSQGDIRLESLVGTGFGHISLSP